jgi:hypothetical protein
MVATPPQNERFIINMEQTPVFYSMSKGSTLEVEGSKTINAGSSSVAGSAMGVSVAVAVTASGYYLHPSIVLQQGKPNCRIKCWVALCLSEEGLDGSIMLDWVARPCVAAICC